MEFIELQKYLVENVKNTDEFMSLLKETVCHLCMNPLSILKDSNVAEIWFRVHSVGIPDHSDFDFCSNRWLESEWGGSQYLLLMGFE